MLGPVMEETLRVAVFIALIVWSVSPTVNKSLLQQTRALRYLSFNVELSSGQNNNISYRWQLVGKVLPFSVLLNELVTHCLNKV